MHSGSSSQLIALALSGTCDHTVWEGWYCGEPVAVKLIDMGGSAQGGLLTTDPRLQRQARMVKRELKLLCNLRFPSIVPFHGYCELTSEHGSHADKLAMVMELAECSVCSLLYAGRTGPLPMPISQAAKIGLAVAKALNYLHGRGIIHRDVKPENVLVMPSGKYVLADFGVAKILEGSDLKTKAQMTLGGDFGTAGYIPPEGYAVDSDSQSDREVTRAFDVYSLGVLLRCLATAQAPYPGMAPEQVRIATRDGLRPDLGELQGTRLGNIIENMWADDPADRPELRQCIVDLNNLAEEASNAASDATHALFRARPKHAVLGDPELNSTMQELATLMQESDASKDNFAKPGGLGFLAKGWASLSGVQRKASARIVLQFCLSNNDHRQAVVDAGLLPLIAEETGPGSSMASVRADCSAALDALESCDNPEHTLAAQQARAAVASGAAAAGTSR